jgi:hypothetical protein
MINLKDSSTAPGRNRAAVYQLSDNKYDGFITAVENNQVRLALEYSAHLIKELIEEVHEQRLELDALRGSLEVIPEPEVESAPTPEEVAPPPPKAKRATKKKAPAAKKEPEPKESVEPDAVSADAG